MNNPAKTVAVGIILVACIVMVLPFVLLLIQALFDGYDNSILRKLINEI